MKTHRLDPVSLLLGIAAVVVGISAINSRLGNILNDRPDALVPLLLIGVGIAAIAIATRRSFQDVHRAGDDQHDRGE
jgi:F0F1-type ATP synthase assembly protein I